MKRFRTQRTIHCTFLRTIVTTSFLSKSLWTSSSHSGAKFKYQRKIHIPVQSHDFSLDVRRLLKFCCLIWLRFDLSWGNYRYSSFFFWFHFTKKEITYIETELEKSGRMLFVRFVSTCKQNSTAKRFVRQKHDFCCYCCCRCFCSAHFSNVLFLRRCWLLAVRVYCYNYIARSNCAVVFSTFGLYTIASPHITFQAIIFNSSNISNETNEMFYVKHNGQKRSWSS